MSIKSNTKAITSAVLLSAAGLIFTACSSTHGGSRASYDSTGYSSGSMSEPSGASASAGGEWQRGTSQNSSYSASASASEPSTSSSESYQGTQAQTQAQPATQGQESAQQEVQIPLHEETVNIGKRTVDAGQVTIRKVVTTETVNQPVQLRREILVIDRVDNNAQGSASGASSSAEVSSAPFQEKTMTFRLQREEPVVQKQMVVKGNVIARRNSQTEQSNVREQVRKESVEVDKGNAGNNVVLHGNFYEIREGAGAQPSGSQSQSEQPQQEQQPK